MSEKNTHPDDYISLIGLRKILFQLITSVFLICQYLVSVIYKSKLLILAGIVIGLVLGYSYYKAKVPRYEVSMIVQSTELNNRTLASMVDQLGGLAQSGSIQKLAEVLNLTPGEAQQLHSLETHELGGETLDKDTSLRIRLPFQIVATVNDRDLSNKLQNSVIDYLNNNPLLKKIKDDETKINLEKVAYVNSEMAKLDSLKTGFNHSLINQRIPTTVYYNAFNPADIYEQSNKLMVMKEGALKALSKETTPVLLIDGFKNTATSQSASLFKSLVLGTLICAFICYFIGLIIDINRKVNARKRAGMA